MIVLAAVSERNNSATRLMDEFGVVMRHVGFGWSRNKMQVRLRNEPLTSARCYKTFLFVCLPILGSDPGACNIKLFTAIVYVFS